MQRWSRRAWGGVAAVLLSAGSGAQGAGEPPFLIHSATDIAHEFTFYFDGRFAAQYTAAGGGVDARIWGTLHKYDLSDVNLLILPAGPTPCFYSAKDVAAVTDFLEAGGGVVILGRYGTFRDEATYRANALVKAFEAEFVDVPAEEPLQVSKALGVEELQTYGSLTLSLARPAEWEVLVRDARDRPVMARRAVGAGQLLVANHGLNGHQPDAKDPINADMWQPLLSDLARGKPVDPVRRPPHMMPENVVEKEALRVQYSDYLAPMADVIVAQYERALPILNEICGVPPSPGMLKTLLLLPTGGGGFSSGESIGLGVWWGGFPDELYGMTELIGHEAGHSWVLPFAEPMWNEPIATYIGVLLAKRLGMEKEAEAVLARNIAGARRLDPEMKTYDIAYGTDVPNAVVWGKTMWIWEQLRAERPDALARYFQAKRRLADPARMNRFTPDDCAAVMSVAMERDLFPWLRSLGLTVDATKTAIPLVW